MMRRDVSTGCLDVREIRSMVPERSRHRDQDDVGGLDLGRVGGEPKATAVQAGAEVLTVDSRNTGLPELQPADPILVEVHPHDVEALVGGDARDRQPHVPLPEHDDPGPPREDQPPQMSRLLHPCPSPTLVEAPTAGPAAARHVLSIQSEMVPLTVS